MSCYTASFYIPVVDARDFDGLIYNKNDFKLIINKNESIRIEFDNMDVVALSDIAKQITTKFDKRPDCYVVFSQKFTIPGIEIEEEADDLRNENKPENSTLIHPKYGFKVNMLNTYILNDILEAINHPHFEEWYENSVKHGIKVQEINIHSIYNTSLGGKHMNYTPVSFDKNGNKINYVTPNTITYKKAQGVW